MDAPPVFVVAGHLRREYILPSSGLPVLDAAGGSLLYAAAGAAVWQGGIGLLGRVGRDFPPEWTDTFKGYGLDVRGIRVLPEPCDLRSFVAYTSDNQPSMLNPVAHFARLGLPFPKSLLGYQPPADTRSLAKVELASPGVTDIPLEFKYAQALHLCPLDSVTQNRLILAFKQGTVNTITLDPPARMMRPAHYEDLRTLMQSVTAFLPGEEEVRALLWGRTNDLWEMAEAIADLGCEIVVIKCGARGQLLYEAPSRRRWEIPAYPARVADPTGAGDAFCGGFLAGYRRSYDPLQAVMHGNVSASLAIEGSGPFYALSVLHGLAEARLKALRDIVREVS